MTKIADNIPSKFRVEHWVRDRNGASSTHEACGTGNITDGNVVAVRANPGRTKSASLISIECDIRIVHVDYLQTVVVKDKWVAMNGDLRRCLGKSTGKSIDFVYGLSDGLQKLSLRLMKCMKVILKYFPDII